MQKLCLMCGYSFSGKSYIADIISKKTGALIISLDKINEERGFDNNSEIPRDEWENTHKISLDRLKDYLNDGKSVIVDDTNPLFKLRERFRKAATEKTTETVVIYVDISKEEIEKRVKKIELNDGRHIAPEKARKDLILMFEKPDPQIEAVVVYKQGEDVNKWVEENF
jgi:predicted kinase